VLIYTILHPAVDECNHPVVCFDSIKAALANIRRKGYEWCKAPHIPFSAFLNPPPGEWGMGYSLLDDKSSLRDGSFLMHKDFGCFQNSRRLALYLHFNFETLIDHALILLLMRCPDLDIRSASIEVGWHFL